MIGKLETAGASAEKTTVKNLSGFDFCIRCAGCQNVYHFHCNLKDLKGHDPDFIVDENVLFLLFKTF